MNTHKEFVPHQPSLDMKELGFDEPCLMYYDYSWTLVESGVYECSAPLYQQAFRWFREKYDITQTIARDGSLAKEGRWAYTIIADLIYFNDGYFTYEEAELACLIKLIELVKNK